MHIDVDVWFEYVRFAANIADWPSCGDYAVLGTGAGWRGARQVRSTETVLKL